MEMANLTYTLQLSRKSQKPENEFGNLVIKTIDECLSSFNKIDKKAIYSVLEKDYEIKKEEIPYKIESFADALEQILGIGAKLVEIGIIESLHKKFPKFMFFSRNGDICFTEYVTSLREFLVHSF
jgi:hypothetical protein